MANAIRRPSVGVVAGDRRDMPRFRTRPIVVGMLLCLPGLLLALYGALATTTCPDCMDALYMVPATETGEAGLLCREAPPHWILDATIGVSAFTLVVAVVGVAIWIVLRWLRAERLALGGRLAGWANLAAMGAVSTLGGLVAISGEGEWRYRYAVLLLPCLAISAALARALLRGREEPVGVRS